MNNIGQTYEESEHIEVESAAAVTLTNTATATVITKPTIASFSLPNPPTFG